ncbi:MAG TPA: hypothetical protein EYG85_11360 [Crocinitomix sp.]|nr:hypothetical protein [Crocinitomix sp.]
MKIYNFFMVFAIVLYASIGYTQEQAPLKTFEFTISVNHLKTQEQSDRIVTKMNQIKGVDNCHLILTDYVLSFQCTNHNLEKYQIIDMMKQIFIEENAEIISINRETIKKNDSKK